ncbi:MAG: class I SAM-dependent rRNA methyltransferase [Elusimicrobiales bacterium]|nr:class I SAM-dependent rRNA methyltransferase [Elusimicrobiales bacterium]
MNNIKNLKLKREALKRRAFGHAWVFSNELELVDTSIPPGTVCGLTYPDGRPAGVGFFNPKSLIAVRLLVQNTNVLPGDFLKERLAAALKYREELGVDRACRLCFGESDGLPGLVVDRYGDAVVIELLSAGMELLKDQLTAALTDLLRPKGIYYKNDHQFRELEGLKSYEETAFGVMPEKVRIEENGLKYDIPMAGGQKTGWYFDQRENRAALEPFFKGRRVLDLHTYLGAFAITAAKAGAEAVWAVDSSEKAIEAAQANAALNGVEGKVLFRKEKAERLIEALEAGDLPEKPDFILLDPPNIVRNKKHLPQALKMLSRMAGAALKSLPKGGYLAVSTCSHHISRGMFVETLSAAASKAGRQAVMVELRGQAKDHPILISMPETEYLHFALLRVV